MQTRMNTTKSPNGSVFSTFGQEKSSLVLDEPGLSSRLTLPNLGASSAWLFNPWIDSLFVCGGLVWILFGIHLWLCQGQPSIGTELPEEAFLLAFGSILLTNSHVAATLVRLYEKKEVRHHFWFHSFIMPACVVLMIVITLSNPICMAVLLRLSICLAVDHTIAQNYGVTLMYCHRGGYVLQRWEKFCLKILHHALIWFVILRQLSYERWIPTEYLGFEIPRLGPIPVEFVNTASAVFSISAAIFALVIVRKTVSSGKTLPLPALLLLITTLFSYRCGVELSAAFLIFIPAFFHATQHMAVATHYKMQEQTTSQVEGSKSKGAFWLRTFLIGSSILVLPPMLLSLIGIPFATAWVSVLICVNLQHFLADRDIWKVRNYSAITSNSN